LNALEKKVRSRPPRKLWACPRCRARFTSRNQQHSCGTFDLASLFARSSPEVRRLYRRFVKLVRRCGPVTIIPQKTRVAFQVRMRFAAVTPGRSSLRGHLVLEAPQHAACFERVDSLSPRSHVHVFRLRPGDELTSEFGRWVRAAYRVGGRSA